MRVLSTNIMNREEDICGNHDDGHEDGTDRCCDGENQ